VKPKIIKLLDQHGYQSFINHTDDGIGHTHLASIFDGKKSHRAYLSVYPDNTHPKSLVNEITAYLLAKALNLPVAKHAFVLTAQVKHLIPAHPSINFSDPNGLYPVWCISEIKGKTPNYHYNLKLLGKNPTFLDDIKAWDKLLDVIVFDDWLGNSDRNTGNLIRTGKRRYALIDHEDIAGSKKWLGSSLNPEQSILNKLAGLIWNSYQPAESKQTGLMVVCAEKNIGANISVLQELVYWWKLLLDDNELKALHRFIMKRATNCPDRIKQRYGSLL